MGNRTADTLARMRTCRDAGLPVPHDLADAVISLLELLLTASERRKMRNRELRLAALLLPANDPPWTKAGHLLKEARVMARSHLEPETGTVRMHLKRAARLGELPNCRKQLVRILAANDDSWTG